ncbi:PQQ-dependent sugar dehydrogenase [Sphingomonas colocasiae]|uniref:PQQ-dependent sugar dehydrogenase n=1 Tax=Sphingomonas colocasiae TaxID=1848973 RepID=A0ABS7PRB7_9SPHN|nr:PQQ-dependent sugar dehydrogenase [Sphingomonas colocasiae]MBY8823773.1 PQQ-dependent sugar dehydrogenase [Sphingomonas colocasiae]
MHPRTILLPALALAAACSAGGGGNAQTASGGDGAAGGATDASTAARAVPAPAPFVATPVATFVEPWAMTFLPGGKQALVTEKKGKLKLLTIDGATAIDVAGVPAVAYGGQGGLGDVVPHPDFARNGLVYLSYAEAGEGDTRGAAVARGKLVLANGGARLENVQVIWRQSPKVSGRGHYGHRILFAPDGHLFISSGERQKFTPAQDMNANLGKILRLNDDGSVPKDNPFADKGGVTAQIWSLGHRNPLGIAFDAKGQLWDMEMGPEGGDELNRVVRGANYGYPTVSNGNHYGGEDIPDHDTRPEFSRPALWWTPVVSPGNLIFYSGDMFPAWKGSAFIPGLSSQSLVRVVTSGSTAREAERFEMGARIREVEQGPDGALWLLEDGENGATGRLLKLTPKG